MKDDDLRCGLEQYFGSVTPPELMKNRPTCADCRQPIEPWELREQFGETLYHSGTCGPAPQST